ncbi:MAG: ribbon-helix-helix domain-containing protein [archaeon YNP-LCB-024-027]|nr:ribbon-helix-helix domain-containing protein [Candidatus Culexarchaeum yellowstonense]
MFNSMVNVKISISIPENLLRRVDELCRSMNMARSEFIAKVLEEKLSESFETGIYRYPTVLWKLRSPRIHGRWIGGWVVEEVEG